MSRHNAAHALHSSSVELLDPGASGTITVDRNPCVCQVTTAAAESRTLARPTRAGVVATVMLYEDGGNLTLTVTGGYNEAGETTLTFDTAGQFATFLSHNVGGTYEWKLLATDAVGGGALNAEVTTTTNVLTAAESGKTIFIDAAGGFVTTLPAPALGLNFRFIVKTSLTSNATIVTSGSSNVVCGQVLTVDVNSATDPDFTATADQDTITLVANKAVKGDMVEVFCDGTSWYVRASCSVFDAITLDQAG